MSVEPLPSAYDPTDCPAGPAAVHRIEVVGHIDEPAHPVFLGAFLGVLSALVAWNVGKRVWRAARTRAWMERQPKTQGGPFREDGSMDWVKLGASPESVRRLDEAQARVDRARERLEEIERKHDVRCADGTIDYYSDRVAAKVNR